MTSPPCGYRTNVASLYSDNHGWIQQWLARRLGNVHDAAELAHDVFLRLLAQRFVATRCPQVAGSLAFTTLLALVPLVTVVIALFTRDGAILHGDRAALRGSKSNGHEAHSLHARFGAVVVVFHMG